MMDAFTDKTMDEPVAAEALGQLFAWARSGLLRHGQSLGLPGLDDPEPLRRRLGQALGGYEAMEWPEIDLLLAEMVRDSGSGLAALVPDPSRDLPSLYLFSLAAAVELDAGIQPVLARIQPPSANGWLRVGSADALLAGLFPDAPALDIPACPLARHRLLMFDGNGPAVGQQLYTSRDFWLALAEGRLLSEFHPLELPADGTAAEELLRAGVRALNDGQGLALHSDPHSARDWVAVLAARLGRRPVTIAHEDWRQRSVRAVARFADWLPLVDCRLHEGIPLEADEVQRQAVLLLRGDQQMPDGYRQLVLPPLDRERRRRWWSGRLDDPDQARILASARLGRGVMERIADQLEGGGADLLRQVRSLRGADASSHLRRVAQAVDTHCEDSMLVLADDTRTALDNCRRRCLHREYADLGMGESIRATARSGVIMLFSGPSGTGKTLASAWLASRLGAPLYKIDLAMVMNKYVGETEKNLSLALDEAAKSDVMLLFDEADALFGKRSDNSQGGDRFANMLTNFLLSRIETHPGLVVLTTNAGSRMDSAFVRRIDVAVEFRPLEFEQRLQLWQRLLARRDPGGDLCRRIARHCELAPGHVRNIVVNACCWHPEEIPLSAASLWHALDEEYRKANRSMPSQLMALKETAEH